MYDTNIKFSDDGTKIVANGNSIAIPSRISLSNNTTTPLNTTALAITKSSLSIAELDVDALGIDGNWVTLNSQRILWLPPEYRPISWERHMNVAVIGSGAGRVTFISCVLTS